MSFCDVCKKPSGEYTLCPECFSLMQEGKVLRCHNCGRWYIKDERCECVKASSQSKEGDAFNFQDAEKNEKIETISQEEKTDRDVQEKSVNNTQKNKPALGCLGGILIFLGIPLLILAISVGPKISSHIEHIEKHPDIYGSETGLFTAFFSLPPDVDIQTPSSLLDFQNVTVKIRANQDYDFLTIKLTFYDEYGVIVTEDFVTENNLKSGEEYLAYYDLTENLTVAQLYKIKSLSCAMYEYEGTIFQHIFE